MERQPDRVSRAVTESQSQSQSTPVAVDILQMLNSDAARNVYERSLSDNELRLIHILPGNESSPIECSTSIAQEGNIPEYEALSYVCQYIYSHPLSCMT